MSLTPEQRQVAEAWASLTSDHFTVLFANLKDFVKVRMGGSELAQAGGWQVLGEILHQRDLLRRERTQSARPPAKGRLKSG